MSAWRAQGTPRARPGQQGRHWTDNNYLLWFYRAAKIPLPHRRCASFYCSKLCTAPTHPEPPQDLVTPGCDSSSLGSRVLHKPFPLLPSYHSCWVVVGVCNTSVDVGNLTKICQTQCSAPKPSEGSQPEEDGVWFWVTSAKSYQVKN